MTGSVLVLGGNGRFGRHAAEAFWNAGWRVRLFQRGADSLPEAAKGADVIVNGWNPPYDRWAAELPRLTAEVIVAARAAGATVILPGNVYVFGPDAPEVFGPATPQGATNPLGRLRVETEAAYRKAGVRTIVLRCGDFLDEEASGNWFDRIIAARAPAGVLSYPGDPDAVHAWAWLADAARAAVALAERRAGLPVFSDIAFPGYTLTGRELAALAEGALARPVRLERMAWWPIRLAVPVWPMARHLLEMRYLWSKPHRMDSRGFDALLPGFAATPPGEAVAAALIPIREAAADSARRSSSRRCAPGLRASRG